MTRVQKIICWVIGLTVFTGFLLARAPASLMTRWVSSTSPLEMTSQSSSGTIWEGRLHDIHLQTKEHSFLIKNLAWKVKVDKLLSGHLAFHLKGDGPDMVVDGDVSLSTAGVDLKNFKSSFPAGLLSVTHPRLKNLDLGGVIHLNTQDFALGVTLFNGKAHYSWENPMTGAVPIGSLRGSFEGEKKNLNWTLVHKDLDAKGSWSAISGFSVKEVTGENPILLKLLSEWF